MIKEYVACVLFGIGLAMGFAPIAIASLLMNKNLFHMCVDQLAAYLKESE